MLGVLLPLLAQTSDFSTQSIDSPAKVIAVAGVVFLFNAVLVAFILVCNWKIYVKAGRPGWQSLVPIYNSMVLAEICGKPSWWGLLTLVPVVNYVISILLLIELAKSFGKSEGFAALLILVPIVGFPMLAFGKDVRYVGPGGAAAASYSGPSAPPATPVVA